MSSFPSATKPPQEGSALAPVESRRGRRLVGRLANGAEVTASVMALCRARAVHAAELRAFGSFAWVELHEYDPQHRTWTEPRRFNTPGTLLQLLGIVSQQDGELQFAATCTLAYSGDNGISVVGGYLVRAEVHELEYVIESFDDAPGTEVNEDLAGSPRAAATTAPSRAEHPSPTPSPAHREPPPRPATTPAVPSFTAPPPAVSPPTSASGWGAVIAASAKRQTEADEEDEAEDGEDLTDEPLRAGDVIEHPTFGRCAVERIEGDHEFAQVRLRNGRLVRLSLDVLRIVRDGQEGSQRRYRAITPR